MADAPQIPGYVKRGSARLDEHLNDHDVCIGYVVHFTETIDGTTIRKHFGSDYAAAKAWAAAANITGEEV